MYFISRQTKSGIGREWENRGSGTATDKSKTGSGMFSSPTLPFKIIRFCDLQFSCGACSPDPFGSNSGSNLLKLAQALVAKSATDIRFLQIWKLHADNWKLLLILSDLQVSIVEMHTLSALQSTTSKLDPSQPSSVLTGFGLSQVRCLCWNPVDQCVYCCSMLLSGILMHAEPWTSKIIKYT